jgi:drug/metabolite transporter (DMT)-like permease
MGRPDKMKAFIFLATTITAWGLEYVLVKAAMDISPVLMGLLVFSVAGMLLFVASVAKGYFKKEIFISNWKSMLLVGIVGSGCNLLWLAGTRLTTVASASVLSRSDILFTLILSSVIFHEKIKKVSLVSIPLMLIGIGIMTDLDIGALKLNSMGDFFVLGSALLLSVNAFIIKKFMKGAGGVNLALANCAVNTVCFGGAVLFFAPSSSLSAVSMKSLLLAISCGCCSFLFFVGYYAALNLLPVWEVRLFCLGVPVVAAFSGYLFLGEVPSLMKVLGGVLILAGAVVALLSNRINLFRKNEIRELNYVEI